MSVATVRHPAPPEGEKNQRVDWMLIKHWKNMGKTSTRLHLPVPLVYWNNLPVWLACKATFLPVKPGSYPFKDPKVPPPSRETCQCPCQRRNWLQPHPAWVPKARLVNRVWSECPGCSCGSWRWGRPPEWLLSKGNIVIHQDLGAAYEQTHMEVS